TIKKQYKDHSLNDFKKWCDNYHGPDPMFEFCRMYSESKTYPDEWGSEKRLKFQESFDAGNFEEKYKKFWQNYALCLNDDHNYPDDQIDTPF
ncbi:MAG: hypothetical protein VYA01_03375, partial [Bacteroidota bacterium]|nr:hypothetical protein [Bacteroidota bacterium]MEC7577091.1 hypothetical protein [Pseudomonadota bacterium]